MANQALTAKLFIKQPKKRIGDTVQDYIDDMENSVNPETGEKYSHGYIANHLKAIKSWAEFSGRRIQRRIKIANNQRRPTLNDERVPVQQELKRVLYAPATSLRTRAAIVLIAHAEVRIETLGDYLGVNGLRISDLKDLRLKDNRVSFQNTPATLVIQLLRGPRQPHNLRAHQTENDEQHG